MQGVEGFVTFLSKKVRENAMSDCVNGNTKSCVPTNKIGGFNKLNDKSKLRLPERDFSLHFEYKIPFEMTLWVR